MCVGVRMPKVAVAYWSVAFPIQERVLVFGCKHRTSVQSQSQQRHMTLMNQLTLEWRSFGPTTTFHATLGFAMTTSTNVWEEARRNGWLIGQHSVHVASEGWHQPFLRGGLCIGGCKVLVTTTWGIVFPPSIGYYAKPPHPMGAFSCAFKYGSAP